MDKFLYICAAVKYSAKMKFVWFKDYEDQIKKPEIKKAMRKTVEKMLHAEITEKRYSKDLT